MLPYGGTTAPTGFLLCYGQVVSQATYAALYAIVGTTFGSDAGGNFTLPDMRGRVPAGQDDMGGSSANRLTGVTGSVDGDVLGGTGGEETHTLTVAEMPAHSHDTVPQNSANSANGAGSFGGSYGSSGSTGGGGAHNNVQPTIIVNYIIKT